MRQNSSQSGVMKFSKEELGLVRFVDKNEDIREEFVAMKCITGGHIASGSPILNTLHQLGLSVDNLRGQCYDRARNMSGEVAAVQVFTGSFGRIHHLHHTCTAPVID